MEIEKTNGSGDELDLAQLMDQIREDAEKRKRDSLRNGSSLFYKQLITQAFDILLTTSRHLHLPLPELKLQPVLPERERYELGELLGFHDEEFVRNAYKAILRREPDDDSFARYLTALRNGRYSKIDLLASLRFSPEGRNANVTIEGLGGLSAFRKLYRVPFFGYFLRMAVAVVRLPVLITNHRRLEFHTAAQLERVAHYLNEAINYFADAERRQSEIIHKQFEIMQEQIDDLKSALRLQIESLSNDLFASLDEKKEEKTPQVDAGEQHTAELQAFRVQLNKQVDDIVERLQNSKMELAQWERRLSFSLDAKSSSEHLQPQTPIVDSNDDHLLDAFYSSLEDGLRGTPEEIKEEAKRYLPILKDAGITSDILDVACGRGGWLEVLKEAGLSAKGIDHNRIQIQRCKRLSLDVVESEALTYLRSLSDESLNAVTAFHFVEHLNIDTLVRFLDEVGRTLRPTGLLIIETPNPENLLVGSCNFYLDPTHKNPIPIPTMQLLLETRGYRCEEVMKLHPVPSVQIEVKDQLTSHVNHFLYGPMNYAIVARKPAKESTQVPMVQ